MQQNKKRKGMWKAVELNQKLANIYKYIMNVYVERRKLLNLVKA